MDGNVLQEKEKNLRVTFENSHESAKPPTISEATKEPTANAKFAIYLQALEKKRSHKEKGSAGSAPATVVNRTTRHDIRQLTLLRSIKRALSPALAETWQLQKR